MTRRHVADFCNGVNTSCPADLHLNSSNLCRAAADLCGIFFGFLFFVFYSLLFSLFFIFSCIQNNIDICHMRKNIAMAAQYLVHQICTATLPACVAPPQAPFVISTLLFLFVFVFILASCCHLIILYTLFYDPSKMSTIIVLATQPTVHKTMPIHL